MFSSKVKNMHFLSLFHIIYKTYLVRVMKTNAENKSHGDRKIKILFHFHHRLELRCCHQAWGRRLGAPRGGRGAGKGQSRLLASLAEVRRPLGAGLEPGLR